jgi:hypothetical protein
MDEVGATFSLLDLAQKGLFAEVDELALDQGGDDVAPPPGGVNGKIGDDDDDDVDDDDDLNPLDLSAADLDTSPNTWTCGVCTFVNHGDLLTCEMCETARVAPGRRPSAAPEPPPAAAAAPPAAAAALPPAARPSTAAAAAAAAAAAVAAAAAAHVAVSPPVSSTSAPSSASSSPTRPPPAAAAPLTSSGSMHARPPPAMPSVTSAQPSRQRSNPFLESPAPKTPPMPKRLGSMAFETPKEKDAPAADSGRDRAQTGSLTGFAATEHGSLQLTTAALDTKEMLLCEGALVKLRGLGQNRRRWFMLTTRKFLYFSEVQRQSKNRRTAHSDDAHVLFLYLPLPFPFPFLFLSFFFFPPPPLQNGGALIASIFLKDILEVADVDTKRMRVSTRHPFGRK